MVFLNYYIFYTQILQSLYYFIYTLGPMFHPDMHGSLAFFKDILSQGDQLKEVPDDSMSFIDVRDLAQLELAALENKNARGKHEELIFDI